MAGVTVINPRKHKRRRRRRTTRAHSKPRRRRRRRYAAASNPRRRRRYSRARRSHSRRRRHRSNPRGGAIVGGLMNGALVATGIVGTRLAAGWLSRMLPAEWSGGAQADLVRIGTKAAIGVALPQVLKGLRVVPAGVANWISVGGMAAVALDAFETFVLPNVPGLSDYELTGYEASGPALALGAAPEMVSQPGNLYEAVYG